MLLVIPVLCVPALCACPCLNAISSIGTCDSAANFLHLIFLFHCNLSWEVLVSANEFSTISELSVASEVSRVMGFRSAPLTQTRAPTLSMAFNSDKLLERHPSRRSKLKLGRVSLNPPVKRPKRSGSTFHKQIHVFCYMPTSPRVFTVAEKHVTLTGFLEIRQN